MKMGSKMALKGKKRIRRESALEARQKAWEQDESGKTGMTDKQQGTFTKKPGSLRKG